MSEGPQKEGIAMEKRNLKLLFFSPKDSDFKSFNIGFNKLVLLSILSTIGLFLITAILTAIIVRFYQNYKITDLKRQNVILISQLSSMQNNLESIRSKLKDLEKFDNDLRILADLPRLDDDMRDVGVGGSVEYGDFALSELPVDLKNSTKNVNMSLDQLDRRIDLQLNSFVEIEKKLHNKKAKIRHFPSIRPVLTGYLKSHFGMRIDPFLDVQKFHPGIDIAAEKGTPVYSPADGVVVKINDKRNLRRDYGRYILIDHGYGIQTLYGHLSKIDVKIGQEVKRWDKIGEVGRTGRSTGYHLHYEVRLNDRAVNPLDYVYNETW